MGNSSVVGDTMNTCGCTGVLGFETSAKALINLHAIEPWNARELVKDNLRRQGDLARRSPLHSVPVEDGLKFIAEKAHGWFQTKLTREQFVQTCVELLNARHVPYSPKDREELYQIFDSMDFDGNGFLSLGEWAGGLSVFLKGNTEQCVHAVFNILAGDRNNTLSKKELQEYLKPFVKAMSPPEAEALRPILLKKATDDIYDEMDLDHNNDITSQEMLEWTQKGNNIIDRLADIIDKEVYRIWLSERHKRLAKEHIDGNSHVALPQADDYSYPCEEAEWPQGPALQQNAYSGQPERKQQANASQSPGWGGVHSTAPLPGWGGQPQSPSRDSGPPHSPGCEWGRGMGGPSSGQRTPPAPPSPGHAWGGQQGKGWGGPGTGQQHHHGQGQSWGGPPSGRHRQGAFGGGQDPFRGQSLPPPPPPPPPHAGGALGRRRYGPPGGGY